jgi:hypothetical protein
MARLNKACLNAFGNRHRFAVADRPQTLNYLFGLLRRVEGLDGRLAGALAFAVLAFSIAGLNAGGVAQDEGGHIDGSGGGEDRRAMAALSQQRQATGVVEMAMREQYGIQLLPGTGWGTVEGLSFLAALEKAAINQDAGLFALKIVCGASYFAASGAEDSDFHEVRWMF